MIITFSNFDYQEAWNVNEKKYSWSNVHKDSYVEATLTGCNISWFHKRKDKGDL